MNDFLTLAAQSAPERSALLDSAGVVGYAELNRQVAGLCAQLASLGVRRGQRAALLLDRSRPAALLLHALARLGLTLVPLNTRLTAAEMLDQTAAAQCAWVFSTLAASPIPALRPADLPAATTAAAGRWLEGQINLEDDFGVLFTSGTSGRPKAAVLSWGNLFWSATASAFRLGVLPADRWLLTLPLFHIGGLSILFRSALYGTGVALPDFPSDQFELSGLWRSLHQHRASLVSLVPTMLYRLLEAQPAAADWPTGLRLILLGGAAAPAELLERAAALALPVAVTYGLSEAASQVATALPELTRRKPGAVGRPLRWTRLQVLDERGQPCAPGQIGEIQVAGPTVMRGYLNQPEATAQALQAGWLKTGDLGYLDDEGDLWLVQRRSDLIISGGENVYPAEVEAALQQHPGVAAACVVGLPHPEWGQLVAAGVVARQPGLKAAELQAHCRQRLAGFKTPRLLAFFDSLPLTASGKINREMVKQWIQAQPLQATISSR